MLRMFGRWVLWSKTPTNAASIAKAPWCMVLHKARAGLKLGCQAENARAAWGRVSGSLAGPTGGCVPCTEGQDSCTLPGLMQAHARVRSGW